VQSAEPNWLTTYNNNNLMSKFVQREIKILRCTHVIMFQFLCDVPIDCVLSCRSAGKLFHDGEVSCPKTSVDTPSDNEATRCSGLESRRRCLSWPLSSQVHNQRLDMETLVYHHCQLVHDALTNWVQLPSAHVVLIRKFISVCMVVTSAMLRLIMGMQQDQIIIQVQRVHMCPT